MQRYFVEPHRLSERDVVIEGDDVHHIVNVMRSSVGDSFLVSDGRGRVALVRLSAVTGKQVHAEVVEFLQQHSELPVRITIGQGLPKGEKMEWILQKGTELGAFAFFPFSSERTIVKLDAKKEAKKLERWRKIVKEAAEQSHRAVLPEILPPASFKQAVAAAGNYTRAVVAYEKEGGRLLHDVLPALNKGDSLLVLIGPEGGFSPEEIAMAESNGILPVSLGPRILRTETASQYILAAASYQWERHT